MSSTPLLPTEIESSYLQHKPPNYDDERYELGKRMISTVLLCIVLIPYAALGLMKKYKIGLKQKDTKRKEEEEEEEEEKKKKEEEEEKKRKKKRKGKKVQEVDTPASPPPAAAAINAAEEEEEEVYLPWYAMPILNSFCFLSLLLLALTSSNNTYTPRAIFQVPLFTHQECNLIIQSALTVAKQNAASQDTKDTEEEEGEVKGWHKKRHANYPTVDLSLQKDGFGKEDREFVEKRLNDRLVPILGRLYGVVPAALRCTDLFIVRYDASTKNNTDTTTQSSLEAHTDSSDISFNILLGSPSSSSTSTSTPFFEGGGTKFYNRAAAATAASSNKNAQMSIYPPVGNALIHSGSMLHEALPITGGTRIIMVGFLSLDRVNESTNKKKNTKLSVFASWASLDWLSVRLLRHSSAGTKRLLQQQQQHPESKGEPMGMVVPKLYAFAGNLLQWWNDMYAPHFHVRLVEKNQKGGGDDDDHDESSGKEYREEFLRVLDEGAEKLREYKRRLKLFEMSKYDGTGKGKEEEEEDDLVSIWFGEDDSIREQELKEGMNEKGMEGEGTSDAHSEF